VGKARLAARLQCLNLGIVWKELFAKFSELLFDSGKIRSPNVFLATDDYEIVTLKTDIDV
jgi:hypothetical protein